MVKKYFLFFIFFFTIASSSASNFKKLDTLLKPKQIIDSLVFSEKLDWSIRLVSNFKQQLFRIKNDDEKISYKPNNPFGIGVGIANQKLVIDILFNIKNEPKNRQTDKFAMEGSFIHKKNLYGFFFENVHGYNVSNSINDNEVFRKDISLMSLSLTFLHLYNAEHFSVRALKRGVTDQEKTTITYGAGGFLLLNKLTSNGSIILPGSQYIFNEENDDEITNFSAYGMGVAGGISSYFVLPANFFAALSVTPGIGLEYKKVRTLNGSYIPTDPLLYKLDLFGSVGYKGQNFYLHFNFGTNFYTTSLDYGNKALLNVTKSKLIFGYNLEKFNLDFLKKIFN